jgi:hypothetical protein
MTPRDQRYPEDLVAFLYILGRDDMTLGRIEEILQDHCHGHSQVTFSNKHLEAYVRTVADRLTTFRALAINDPEAYKAASL